MSQPSGAPHWWSNIGTIALTNCIATVLSLLIPLWKLTQQATVRPLTAWITVPMILITCLFAAIMPVFYYGLYRNERRLQFSKGLRQLSMVAAVVLGLLAAWGLSDFTRSLSSYWSLISLLDIRSGATIMRAIALDPRTITQVENLLGQCATFAYLFLLLAFIRPSLQETSADTQLPASLSFGPLTKLTVIVQSLVVAFFIVRLVAMPFIHAYLQTLASKGVRTWPLGPWMLQNSQMLLTQACLFVAPYVVYKSRSRSEEVAGEMQPVPTD
jgi:hypothetical protein